MSTYLITGGTGSLSLGLINYISDYYPEDRIVVFSRDEQKQHTMREELNNNKISFVIGDVRDYESLENTFHDYFPDYVIHAAAMKHVPECEENPWQAVLTNVCGAHNIVRACKRFGINRAVAISTDKAVNPHVTMGMTKALQERLFLKGDSDHGSSEFSVVRFGNVIGSRGSVIPFFDQLGKRGSPLPVTDPSMTRFVFPRSEAVKLVMFALLVAPPGYLYLPLMTGMSMRLLAEVFTEHYQVPVHIRGLRSNERIHEMIASPEESPRLFKVTCDDCPYLMWIPPHVNFATSQGSVVDAKLLRSDTTTHEDFDSLSDLLKDEGFLSD